MYKTFLAEINPTVNKCYTSIVDEQEVQVLAIGDANIQVHFLGSTLITWITCGMFFRLFGSDLGH